MSTPLTDLWNAVEAARAIGITYGEIFAAAEPITVAEIFADLKPTNPGLTLGQVINEAGERRVPSVEEAMPIEPNPLIAELERQWAAEDQAARQCSVPTCTNDNVPGDAAGHCIVHRHMLAHARKEQAA